MDHLDKFLRRENVRVKQPSRSRRVIRKETKRERESRINKNLKLVRTFCNKLLKTSVLSYKIEILDYEEDFLIIVGTDSELNEIIDEAVLYYHRTGNLRYSIEKLDKRAI